LVVFNVSEKWSNGNKRSFTGFDPDDQRVEAIGTLFNVGGKGNCNITGNRRKIFCYYNNINAILTVTLIPYFKNNRDSCSLKMRSRHNEPGMYCHDEDPHQLDGKRFGGYGFAVSRINCESRREPAHFCHDQVKQFKLPRELKNGRQVKIRQTVRDEGKLVHQKGEIDYLDGKGFFEVMDTYDRTPEPWMIDRKLYETKSYIWIRNNGEGSISVRNVSLEILP